jgi:ABC-2 type transport system permease protein
MIDHSRIERGHPRLTFWRLTKAQLRVALGDSLTIWGIIAVLLASLVSGIVAGISGSSPHGSTDAIASVNVAIGFAAIAIQLFAITLGSHAIAGEFSRGTIGATLAAAPQRAHLFAAKVLTTCGSVSLLAVLVGFVAGGSALAVVALGGQEPWHPAVGALFADTAGLSLGAGTLSLLVLALGALSRQRLVAVLAPIVALYILPILSGLLPVGFGRDVITVGLPGTAFAALSTAHASGGGVSLGLPRASGLEVTMGTAIAVLALWCLALVPLSLVSFLLRDASITPGTRAVRFARPPVQTDHDRRAFRSTQRGLLRSEVVKLWRNPAVRWIVASAVLLEMGFGVARAAWGSVADVGANLSESLAIEFSYAITGGIGGVALLFALLAAIQVAGEFETGTAISTFIAAPRRIRVTVSKILVVAITSVAIGFLALGFTWLIVIPVYASRGFDINHEALVFGGESSVRACLFLLLTTLMSAGVAGVLRRSVAAVMTVSVLLIIGPSLLNVVLGLARVAQSPIVALGNAARLLPWEGANWLLPFDGGQPFASIDSGGVLLVSAQFGFAITAVWTVVALVAWLVTDANRAIALR